MKSLWAQLSHTKKTWYLNLHNKCVFFFFLHQNFLTIICSQKNHHKKVIPIPPRHLKKWWPHLDMVPKILNEIVSVRKKKVGWEKCFSDNLSQLFVLNICSSIIYIKYLFFVQVIVASYFIYIFCSGYCRKLFHL